ncbi:hypothetical protein ACMFMG_004099 [Clarireedia jacksonii]
MLCPLSCSPSPHSQSITTTNSSILQSFFQTTKFKMEAQGFNHSAEDIRIDDKHILRARLRKEDGGWNDAQFDLDRVLGNENGMIHWDGNNFSHSSEDVTFHIEGGAQVPVLRAHLRSRDGEEFSRDVNLAERIQNRNGEFYYQQ